MNGSATPSQTLPLTGSIAAGDVFVVCNASASAGILAACDLVDSATMSFNGDDVVELSCASTLDVIGQIGVDPGSGWGSAPEATVDQTLVRKCGVTHGDADGSNAFDPATEWMGFPQDTIGDLGTASCAP